MAALLFLGTAAFVCWQNARVAVLWDLGYLLDTSWRIALGQMPYRDFPLVHPPLTFLIQAGLIRLMGRHYLVQIIYAAACGGVATVMTWRIALHLLRRSGFSNAMQWGVALLLSAPLTIVGVYSIYPHPIYDCDCVLAILVAVLLLARLDGINTAPRQGTVIPLAAGAATVAPVFFKQNMGLPMMGAAVAGMLFLLAAESLETRSLRLVARSPAAWVLAGIGLALLAGAVAIAGTAGLGNYLHWTMQFAAQRRLPGLAAMLSVYRQPSLVWTVPAFGTGLLLCHTRLMARGWAKVSAFCLLAAPFAWSLIFLLMEDDADERADNLLALWPLLLLAAAVVALVRLRRGVTLGRLLPLIILAAIQGTFLSQQLWGSTYALWPLLVILIAFVIAALPPQARTVAVGTAAAVSACFAVCGGVYAVSLERLSYIQIPDTPVMHTSTAALRGMGTPGGFLPNLDELVEYTRREIPENDALLLLPGEDPFYYATGRRPRFPVTLFDPATDPYSAAELLEKARRREVKWVMVKRTLQIDTNPLPEADRTMLLVQRDFAICARLRGYDIYRRR